jgi:hypothetical protein
MDVLQSRVLGEPRYLVMQGSLVHKVVGLLVEVKQNTKKELVAPSYDEFQLVYGAEPNCCPPDKSGLGGPSGVFGGIGGVGVS